MIELVADKFACALRHLHHQPGSNDISNSNRSPSIRFRPVNTKTPNKFASAGLNFEDPRKNVIKCCWHYTGQPFGCSTCMGDGFARQRATAARLTQSAKQGQFSLCEFRFQWHSKRNGFRRDCRRHDVEVEASACEWLKEMRAAEVQKVQTSTTAYFLVLQDLLRRLNAADETEMQNLSSSLGMEKLCLVEAELRERAINIFEEKKFEFARREPNFLRADLLRPNFGCVSCEDILDSTRSAWSLECDSERNVVLARSLAVLAGCQEEDASSLLKFARRLSELFAPIEFTKQIARQDWDRFPFAFGAAVLPSLDAAVRSLKAAAGTKTLKVAVFGAAGCLSAALCSRLGCETSLAEPSKLLCSCLSELFKNNGVSCVVGEEADAAADLFVLSLDEDGLFEWGQLKHLKKHLQKRQGITASSGIETMPKILPETFCVKAALIDDSLSQVRGCQMNRFEKMRGLDLAISHRWPRGACHIRPFFRSAPQQIFDFSDAAERYHVSFVPEVGMPVNGIAYWVEFNDLPELKEVFCCIQPLPMRRVEGGALHLWAHFSDVKVWFEWADSDGPGQLTFRSPPLGKTKLPPWHFKMLNDHERNRRYHMAIARAVARKQAQAAQTAQATAGGPRVLDCGCGAGLLSLLALREGSSFVTAVELSPLIADLTKEIFQDHLKDPTNCVKNSDWKKRFSLLTADVRQLSVEEVGHHDIIVSELMDASGLGESLLSVLQHACRTLAAPGAQVIPCGIRLVGALGWHKLPNCHDAFDFSALNALYFCSQQGGPFSQDSWHALMSQITMSLGVA